MINFPACTDNLDSFIDMDAGTGLGTVMTLKQLFERFYRSKAVPAAAQQVQAQATAT